MLRTSIALLGKALWLVFLIGLFAMSSFLIWERHLLSGVAFGFFAVCFSASWVRGAFSESMRSDTVLGQSDSPDICQSAQDFAICEATGSVAVAMAIAASEGRISTVASSGKEMNSDDDDPLLDSFDCGGFGSLCATPTGDDRF